MPDSNYCQFDTLPSDGHATGSASPSPRLAALGFQHDPFAYFEAEKMPPEILEATFVGHPGFDQHIMDPNRSAALVAPRGSGKTAGRLRLAIALNRRQRRIFSGFSSEEGPLYAPLVVSYTNFEGIVKHLPTVDLSHHAKPLLAAVAETVYILITAYPDRFMALGDKSREWWWAFLEAYLSGVPITYRLRESPMAADWQPPTERPPPFCPDSTLEDIFNGLQRELAGLGIDTLFILVDGVDGYIETQPLSGLEALVAPLLNTLPLLSFPGIVWKFFLPDLLEETVRNSAGYQSGRLNLVPINWDEHSLAELLGLWLMWASEGLIQDMAQLCEVDLLRVVDIEQKLIQMALRHRLGPPRALLDLTSKLLQ